MTKINDSASKCDRNKHTNDFLYKIQLTPFQAKTVIFYYLLLEICFGLVNKDTSSCLTGIGAKYRRIFNKCLVSFSEHVYLKLSSLAYLLHLLSEYFHM